MARQELGTSALPNQPPAGEKESAAGEPVKVVPVAGARKVLSAPTGVTATPGDGKITLAWGEVAGASGYRVYYGTSKDQLGTIVDVAGATSAEIAGLTNGTAYYFAVTALDVGGSESGRSEIVTATPSATAVSTGTALCTLDVGKINSCALG